MKSKKELAEQCLQRISDIRENIAHYAECGDWEMAQMNQQQLDHMLEQLDRYL
jgi:hypothetical protein